MKVTGRIMNSVGKENIVRKTIAFTRENLDLADMKGKE